jgi:hypothetical protein
MAEEPYSTFRIDPYDVITYFRNRGQSFTRIAREMPIWKIHDPARRPVTGPELERWYDQETIRRCCPSPQSR